MSDRILDFGRSSLWTVGFLTTSTLSFAGAAAANTTTPIPPQPAISFGARVRFSYTFLDEQPQANGVDASGFSFESFRLSVSAKTATLLKAVLSIDRDRPPRADRMRILDAIAQIRLDDSVNIWLGRMLPPSDRANLAGSYSSGAWSYPAIASRYPSIFGGRDNGIAVWGHLLRDRLLYAGGLFEGRNRALHLSNQLSSPLVASRLAFSLIAPEPSTAYYASSSYMGRNDILVLGLATMWQHDGVGTVNASGDYAAWNIDALFETRRRPFGSLTLEAAYYQYNTTHVIDATPTQCAGNHNCGNAATGTAYIAGVSYLLGSTGPLNQYQPFVRHQHFEPARGFGSPISQTELGLKLFIASPNSYLAIAVMRTTNKADKLIMAFQHAY